MPCADGYDSPYRTQQEIIEAKKYLDLLNKGEKLTIRQLDLIQLRLNSFDYEALICSILRFCEEENINILDKLNYSKSGLNKKKILDWWKIHKIIDEQKGD